MINRRTKGIERKAQNDKRNIRLTTYKYSLIQLTLIYLFIYSLPSSFLLLFPSVPNSQTDAPDISASYP